MTKRQAPVVASSSVAGRIKDAATLEAGRDRLLKGARRCFSDKGYGGASVQDIADAAGVSIGSFYKYVRAKEDLLCLMAEASHERMRNVIEHAFSRADDPVAGLESVVAKLIRTADRDRDLMGLLYAEFKYMPTASKRLTLEQEKILLDRLSAVIESGNAVGVFDCSDPEMAALDIEMFGSIWVLKSHLVGLDLPKYIRRQVGVALRLVRARGHRHAG
jgi:AcrR family transcriptional regulator